SFRQYSAAVADIERRLIDEKIPQKNPPDEIRGGATPAEGLLTREDRLENRAIPRGPPWERDGPQAIFTHDPAVMKLLSLDQAVTRLRDETQPQAREAARRLDEFIRSRGLDQVAEKKTDYYYRGDQIPGGELEQLSLADRRAFAALEAHAGETLAGFEGGVKADDKRQVWGEW